MQPAMLQRWLRNYKPSNYPCRQCHSPDRPLQSTIVSLGVREGTHPVPGESDHIKLHAVACGQNCGLFNVGEGC